MAQRHRCVICDLTFTCDFDLKIVQASSALFRRELVVMVIPLAQNMDYST